MQRRILGRYHFLSELDQFGWVGTVLPPGGTICFPRATCAPLVSLIWVPPPGGTIWDRSYLHSIGRDSLGSATGRNNLCLLSNGWLNLRPRRELLSPGWLDVGSRSYTSSVRRNNLCPRRELLSLGRLYLGSRSYTSSGWRNNLHPRRELLSSSRLTLGSRS